MRLYVFNPDTDMALADNRESYMAPESIRNMMEDLAMLPMWYAKPCSAVLAPSAYNSEFLQKMKALFPLNIQLVTEPELPEFSVTSVMPWGWNLAFRKRMHKAGVAERVLISREGLSSLRQASSRMNVVTPGFFYELNSDLERVCGYQIPITKADLENDDLFIEKSAIGFENGFLLKSLWSGSGRGLRWCRNGMTKSTLDWCKQELAKHGAVMFEPIYDKVGDFAMEFHVDARHKLSFCGYSRFVTNENGAYRSSVLTSDEEIEKWICQYVPKADFEMIRNFVPGVLGILELSPVETFVGVDMMICHDTDGDGYVIHPNVEINMRMTMGVVTRQFYDRYVSPDSEGDFSIDSCPTAEELQAQHEQDEKNHPLVVKDGRIISGYMSLTPITPKSKYRAYVRVRER